MVVVADTSPLHYLVLVEAVEILPQLFGRIIVPEEVRDELKHVRTPQSVREWIESNPEWIQPAVVDRSQPRQILELDPGETAVILVAEQQSELAFVVMDDAKGRREATVRGIPNIGTLGVLRAASARGLLSLQDILPELKKTNFYVADALLESLIAEEAKLRR